jgi:hypothetical protein
VTGKNPDVSTACDRTMARSSTLNPTAWMNTVTTTKPTAKSIFMSIDG